MQVNDLHSLAIYIFAVRSSKMHLRVLLFSVLDEPDGIVIKKFILFSFDLILFRIFFVNARGYPAED